MAFEILGEYKDRFEKIFKRDTFQPREYHFKELKELEEPIENVVRFLRESIDRGDYDTLISDDASARIPVLILRKVIRGRIEALNPDQAPEERREALKTFFVAGGRHSGNEQAILDFFKKIKPEIKRRAILATEFVDSGRSIAHIAVLLERAGIPFDVVSIGSYDSLSKYQSEFDYLKRDHRLLIGKAGFTPGIYGTDQLGGVRKDRVHPKNPHPVPRYGVSDGVDFKEVDKSGLMEKAREDVGTMAKFLIEKTWGKK